MTPNPKIVFIVVCSLSLALFGGMLATYFLIIQDKDAALIAIISGHTGTALGGLLSILSRTGATADKAPSKVEVTNTVKNPVPTEESGATVSTSKQK